MFEEPRSFAYFRRERALSSSALLSFCPFVPKTCSIARAALATLMLVSSVRSLRADEPALVVPDSLQFAAPTELRFSVYTTSGHVTGLRVVPKDFKDPAGKDRPTPFTAVEVGDVTPSGAQVVLTVPKDAFPVVGDYRVTLVFDAKTPEGKPVSLLKTAAITRPKPDVTAPGLKDYAFRVERLVPWANASKTFDVDLVNNGPVDLDGASVDGGAVNLDGDPKETINAKVKPALEKPSLARGKNDLKLELSDFDQAGTFQTRLWVTPGPDLPREEIPFKVIVSDEVFAPLLVIFLGVLAGFAVNLIATRFKPAQETVVRVAQLRELVVDAARLTSDAASVAKANGILERLRSIEFDNAMSDAAAIKTRLDQVAAEVNELQTATFALVNEVAQMRAAVADSMAALSRAAGEDANKKQRVASLVGDLDAVDERMAEHANARAKDLMTELTAAIEKARAEFAPAVPAAAPGAVQTRGKFSFVPKPASAAQAAPPLPRMEVRPAAPRAGDAVRFAVVDADHSSFQWNFGEGQPMVGGAKASHVYFADGEYPVIATPTGGGDPVRGAVVVAAPQFAAVARKAQRWWWVAEAALSSIGLLVATATGLWLLWASVKVFGTWTQYIEAFVWGFGMDSSVRGVAQVMSKLRGGV